MKDFRYIICARGNHFLYVPQKNFIQWVVLVEMFTYKLEVLAYINIRIFTESQG